MSYLPPHSPDPDPIEQAFAGLGHLLRPARRRRIEESWNEIGSSLERFGPPERASPLANSDHRIT